MINVALVNDDGVYAEGLKSLAIELIRRNAARLYVLAPDREYSGSGHGITMSHPVTPRRIDWGIPEANDVYLMSGTPADCAKLAVSELIFPRPDLLISGINRGANLGFDCRYSGTVSAAFEGAYQGIPAVAVSLHIRKAMNFSLAAEIACDYIFDNLELIKSHPETVFNLNIPDITAKGELNGLKITRMNRFRYFDSYKTIVHRSRTSYWLAGEIFTADEAADSDYIAVSSGYVSLTPLQIDFTDYQLFQQLNSMTDKS